MADKHIRVNAIAPGIVAVGMAKKNGIRNLNIGSAPVASKQMIMNMIGKLKEDGILKTVRAGSGRRAQVLALAELINLCEGRTSI